MAKAARTALASVTVLALGTGGTSPAGAVPRVEPWPRPTTSCAGRAQDCVAGLKETLAALRDGLGCDHRAPFAALYVQLQDALGWTLRERPGYFTEPSWVARDLNAAFAGRYLSAYEADRAGLPVPESWRIAFAAARGGDTNAGQDALLGANAHIQRDMPYALAASGLVRGDGGSRKADFDRIQAVLDRAYGPAVRDVTRHYDPLLALADDRWNPVAGRTAHELFALWRQNAWRYAARLARARDAGERRRTAEAVEANAAAWAVLLRAVRVPGYGTVRDAHCRAHLPPGAPAARDMPPTA
ncbi:DUF5995 family protein [Streptomyces cinnamoneus]|uniref:DUF5995 family protein n=1 Tax=Streptomyces cinnamoneus TaxID=53446 RepID=UPI003792F886